MTKINMIWLQLRHDSICRCGGVRYGAETWKMREGGFSTQATTGDFGFDSSLILLHGKREK